MKPDLIDEIAEKWQAEWMREDLPIEKHPTVADVIKAAITEYAQRSDAPDYDRISTLKMPKKVLFTGTLDIHKDGTITKADAPEAKSEVMQKLNEFVAAQKPLPPEFAKILNDNIWDLYESCPEAKDSGVTVPLYLCHLDNGQCGVGGYCDGCPHVDHTTDHRSKEITKRLRK